VIIDSHTHIGSTDTARYPLRTTERSDGTIWFLDHLVTAERFIDLMDGAGVGSAVFVQAMGPHGTDNRYVVDSAAQHRDRAVAVGAIDVHTDPEPRQKLADLARDGGVQGVRLFDMNNSGALESAAARDVARDAAAMGLPVLVMTGFAQVPAVRWLAEQVPEAALVLDHCCSPDLSAGPPWSAAIAVLELAELANIYLKVTSMNLLEAPDGTAGALVADLAGVFGADRLLWGSDFPHTFVPPYATLVTLAADAASSLNVADRERFLAATAVELWPGLRTT